MIFIVMGVTGCGKSTIGSRLAAKLGLPFYDGDDYHLPDNIAKMQAGIPLNDEDRLPWLRHLAAEIIKWEAEGGAVVACSALKEAYRKILHTVPDMEWIFLDGSRELLSERLNSRAAHFMSPALLDSQLEALEKPAYGLHLNIAMAPDQIVQQILKHYTMNNTAEFGFIGMGVMGSSLALNMAEKGVQISAYNRHVSGKEENIAKQILIDNPHFRNIYAFDNLEAFIDSLERPRKVLLMIFAGAVDIQIEELIPILEPGDVIIDGGNSLYKDTSRREKLLAQKGIHFIGAGISGGEEGARKGPSIMPGGSKEGYLQVEKYFELLAAKDKAGKACTAYIGPEGAGHFVKMVHNGIEYAEMQALAEVYYLLRYYLQQSPEEIINTFTHWQQHGLNSYLLEITIDILRVKEEDELLIDKILDQAEQKGTGGWSVGAALEYGVPFSSLSEAVMARALSAMKPKREYAAAVYDHQPLVNTAEQEIFLSRLRNAYQATRIINHETGFDLIQETSRQLNWNLNLSEISRIWTNGCIIRSELMEQLTEVFKTEDSILTAPVFVPDMRKWQLDYSYVVAQALRHGFAVPVLSAGLNYFLGRITAHLPANLVQAQRDYFGAHTYRRNDRPADQHFHTSWKKKQKV